MSTEQRLSNLENQVSDLKDQLDRIETMIDPNQGQETQENPIVELLTSLNNQIGGVELTIDNVAQKVGARSVIGSGPQQDS